MGQEGKVGKVIGGDKEVRNVSMERANIRQGKSQTTEGREWVGNEKPSATWEAGSGQ